VEKLAGENISIEYKTEQVHPDSLAREMTAFSNTYGGTIYVGVNDDGSVSGLTLERKWDEWAANIARNNINPSISPLIEFESIDNKEILKITVSKGRHKPYQTLNDGKYWIRVGSTVRQATQQELSRLFQMAGLVHFDISPVENSSIKDLSTVKLASYFNKSYGIIWEEEEILPLLKNTSILNEIDNTLCASVGGLLLFSEFPERFLPHAVISIAVINGITITDPVIQKKEITGSLPDQIDTAVSFLQLFSPEPLIVKDKAQREETTAVSIKVLREAVVNAVCHRDYSILNRKIHIFIYKNRIEIQSPGRIANTLTLNMIKAGNSAPRNIFLLKLLDNLHYIDGLGRGIPLIIKEMKDRVIFKEDGELFTVVLYF